MDISMDVFYVLFALFVSNDPWNATGCIWMLPVKYWFSIFFYSLIPRWVRASASANVSLNKSSRHECKSSRLCDLYPRFIQSKIQIKANKFAWIEVNQHKAKPFTYLLASIATMIILTTAIILSWLWRDTPQFAYSFSNLFLINYSIVYKITSPINFPNFIFVFSIGTSYDNLWIWMNLRLPGPSYIPSYFIVIVAKKK